MSETEIGTSLGVITTLATDVQKQYVKIRRIKVRTDERNSTIIRMSSRGATTIYYLPKPLFLYVSMVLLSTVVLYSLLCITVVMLGYEWWLCMVINISVQYSGGLLPDIIRLTQGYYQWGTRLYTM